MGRKPLSLVGTFVGCLFTVTGVLFGPRCGGADLPAVIAYDIPAGTQGNQDFEGSLGMDFDVALDIVVTRLGVFDSGSDGLKLPITARLFDRDLLEELATLVFTPDDQGELIGGSRFKDLEEPLELPAGFHGTMSADGYSVAELNGNQGGADLGLLTNDGGCSISFLGGGRYGDEATPGNFPDHVDGGPSNRYASGTFVFKPTESFTPTGAIAYAAPDGTTGTQNFGGALGLDFNVNQAIRVTRLGVFDSTGDGLVSPITARIYHRIAQAELASLVFTPEAPGDLEGVFLFKELDPPLRLPPGFRGTIAASGFNASDMNGNGNYGQTADNGGCAISFVGGGRFGSLPDAFPRFRDNGPFNRYLAGNFEFEIDPSPPPTPPETPEKLAAFAGDGRVDLTWQAPVGPTPAVMYRLFRATGGGAFAKIAELPGTSYSDTGLTNDVDVCYHVVAVAQDATESLPSRGVCSMPVAPLPAGQHISYLVRQGTSGNQDYPGGLGMDFDVKGDIRIHHLGVFDDGSDGLKLPITARVFDRDTQTELAILEFTPDDAGVLIGGSRYKVLDPPLDLDAGFHGTMSASGYGRGEFNGNQGVGRIGGMTMDTGECRISFLGGGRYGNDPNLFPSIPDGGPVNRYAAGTFVFSGRNDQKLPGAPVLTTTPGEGQVTLSWEPVPAGECALESKSYRVFRSKDGGAYGEIGTTANTVYVDGGLAKGNYCYRVRAVADGGVEGEDSASFCETLGLFIAYKVPEGTIGNQTDGQIVGMDFNVNLDIKVHHLGFFDSGGDGVQVPLITVRIYDRDLAEEVVSLEFTEDEPGTLLGGSRFLEVAPPLDLPAGFKGSIVAEGYSIDEPYGSGGPWTTDQGPCSISFVGRGRTGAVAGIMPDATGLGRPDQYAAGSFMFEAVDLGSPRGAIAYVIPEASVGNQQHKGQLGMDFNVNVDIKVTRLGVFDSASDGLFRNITAYLFDRRTQAALTSLEFTIDDPGDLEGGSRFKPLDPPLALPAGFRGTMSAVGYGPREPNGNFLNNLDMPFTTDDGGCAIQFVGGGRFGPGTTPADFPTLLDGGPVNRYASGTFEFEVSEGPPTGTFRRGDVDGSGAFDVTDPVFLLGYLFLGGPSPSCLDAADFDDSGLLDITDAVNNLGYQFLGGPAPEPPGPLACGPDPTGDNLGCVGTCK